jgi:glutathione synthase/RimK-type ligase-like ATP-grasp enzyme
MRVALASFAGMPEGWDDDAILAEALREAGADAQVEPWDDPAVDWDRYHVVVIRSTWNYTADRDAFLAWADAIGERLRNRPEVVRWNSDKAYLADLAATGLPVVETSFIEPGDADPELRGEVVVKPSISAGARDTGRFSPGSHAEARALLRRLRANGATAMIQPYLSALDERGETAIVFLAGRESHVLRKQPVLRPDEVAPVRDDAIGAAEAMYRDDLVGPGEATEAERELAREVIAYVSRRFGTPLYARVDIVPGPDQEPVLLELEAVEPNLYFNVEPGAASRLAGLIVTDSED